MIKRTDDTYRSRHYQKMSEGQKNHFDGLEEFFRKEIEKAEERFAELLLSRETNINTSEMAGIRRDEKEREARSRSEHMQAHSFD